LERLGLIFWGGLGVGNGVTWRGGTLGEGLRKGLDATPLIKLDEQKKRKSEPVIKTRTVPSISQKTQHSARNKESG